MSTQLSNFTIGSYKAGARIKIFLWYPINYFVLQSSIPYPSFLKVILLRLFGAKVGSRVLIKPRVRIKYPWKLKIGNSCWLGEDVWIDNLAEVSISNNVCISQGAMLLTGNHDFTKSDFPYRLGPISLEDGVWIGAKAVVCPGVICCSHSILTVNSVANKNLQKFQIYRGNPAISIKIRQFEFS